MDEFEPYRVLAECGTGEIEEKKSRFISNFRTVESQEEAVCFIEEMKKRYWDARHNCFAYIIGRKAETVRYSDDGEPNQTAGRPMLEVLKGAGLKNAAVVVTRYFGGVLLGTGGLARAYASAVQEGLKNCKIAEMRYGTGLLVEMDYNAAGKLQYILGKKEIAVQDTEYSDVVRMRLLVPYEETERLEKELIDATGARIRLERAGDCYYRLDPA